MVRGVRARLTATLVFLVVLTAIVLGIAAYVFVDVRLHQQALDDAEGQARFDLSVIAPPRLSNPPTPEEVGSRPGLPDARPRHDHHPGRRRGELEPASLEGARMPPGRRSRVHRRGARLAYAWQPVAGRPTLVIGGRIAGDRAGVLLLPRRVRPSSRRWISCASPSASGRSLLALVAVVAARVVARGVLAPVDAAGRAAERIAGGDLSAASRSPRSDEFGLWADALQRDGRPLEDTIVRLERPRPRTASSSRTCPTSSGRRWPRSSPRPRSSRPTLTGLPPDARRAARTRWCTTSAGSERSSRT